LFYFRTNVNTTIAHDTKTKQKVACTTSLEGKHDGSKPLPRVPHKQNFTNGLRHSSQRMRDT